MQRTVEAKGCAEGGCVAACGEGVFRLLETGRDTSWQAEAVVCCLVSPVLLCVAAALVLLVLGKGLRGAALVLERNCCCM